MFLVKMPNVSPHELAVMIRETALFGCSSLIRARWKFDDGNLPFNTVMLKGKRNNEYFLRINKVDFSNAGSYSCEGVDPETKKYFYDIGELSVVGKLFTISVMCFSRIQLQPFPGHTPQK